MIKKISAIILALVLCISVMVVPASAAVELGDAQIAFSIEFDKESYNAGDTAILSVYMDAEDSLSLATGSFLIGLSSDVFDPTAHTTADLKATGMNAEWFESYYTPASGGLSQLASTVVPKVQAANTDEENELYDWYVKYTAGKNSAGGWHDSIGTTKDGFHGDEFIADEPIIQIVLTVRDDVPNGTVANAAITSGSLTSTPIQTSWKYYKNPGNATTTASISASNIDASQAVATATIGATACEHANTTATEEITANATCTAAGSKVVTTVCDDCGETVSTETVAIPATGHTATTVDGTPADCVNTGLTAGSKCSVCGETLTAQDVIPALGHKYNAVVTAPTCTAAGYTTYTCSVCNDTYVADEGAATGHTYTAAETTAPTCTEAGVMTYTCACGDTYTEEIAVKGHTLTAVEAKAPTCTAAGYEAYEYCTVCDYTTYAEVAATGHNYEENIVREPTCSTVGKKNNKCSVCGTIETGSMTDIPKADHNYEAVVTAPTCAAVGYTTYTCTACGDSYTADEVAKLEHTYEETYVKNPTCAKEGYTEYTCAVCGDLYKDPIPAKNHKYEDGSSALVEIPAVAPTCKKQGYTAGSKCQICNSNVVAPQGIPATGHTKENGVVTEPTYFDGGWTTYTCPVCGEDFKDDFVDKLVVGFTFKVAEPSVTVLRARDTIILHPEFEGEVAEGVTVVWTADNENFKIVEVYEDGSVKVEAKKVVRGTDGITTFTATVVDADGKEITSDTVELTANAKFFQQFLGFFRAIFRMAMNYDK